MTALIVIGTVLALLALPAVLKPKGRPPLVGPDLASLVYTEVSFTNTIDELQLGGMLFVPEGEGPHPAAVLIHGSGTSRRNSKWYLSIAAHLQKHGVAVLLPDKRGCEKSEGSWVGVTFEELANDTLAAVDFMSQQDHVEASSLGVIGMSQGAWIASIVGAQRDDLAFVVSMSGGAVTTDEQLLHEEIYNIEPYTYSFLARLIAPITTQRLLKMESLAPLAGFDPIPYWLQTSAPVFFAYGGDDRNVSVEASIARLRENGLDHHRIEVYPGGGHGISDPATNEVSTEYLEDLAEFIMEAASEG